jgi:hypothetical protein
MTFTYHQTLFGKRLATARVCFSHACRYMHSNVEEKDDPSSVHRMQRVKEMQPPKSVHDLQVILGDTQDKEYPIFRTATPPDQSATLATGWYSFLA